MNERINLRIARPPHGHARSVIEHNVHALHIVRNLAAQQSMHTATVVADHAAQRAAAVRRRVRRIRQVMHLSRLTHPIEHDARFDHRQPRLRINRDQLPHVP
jgi:hypothetical protein